MTLTPQTFTPASVTVQCFVDYAVDEAGKVTVTFRPEAMDRDFFAHADVNGRTAHEGWDDPDEPATDEDWEAIEAALARIEETFRDGDSYSITIVR